MAADARPSVAPLFRLQFEPAQQSWVLLYPEGMVRLNEAAAEILRRCDGQRTVAALITELEQAFGEPDLSADVHEFLIDAHGRGWLA